MKGIPRTAQTPALAMTEEPSLRLGGQGVLGRRRELRKRSGILHGEVGQNFAVEFDAARLQTVHELAVGKAAQTRRGADALNPQLAELPLAVAAVAIGEPFGAPHGFLGGLEELALGKEKSFRTPKVFFPARAAFGAALDSGHGLFSCEANQPAGRSPRRVENVRRGGLRSAGGGPAGRQARRGGLRAAWRGKKIEQTATTVSR